MEIFDVLRQRRAVRSYKSEAVPEDLLRQLVQAACWAPSPRNCQSWHFVVVTDPNVLDAISRGSKEWLLKNDAALGEHPEMRAHFTAPGISVLHNAPAMIAIAAPAADRWGAQTCALAAENLMLAASALGLGSCWIGLSEGWLNTPEGLRTLGLPGEKKVIAPIVIGYPREIPPPVARRESKITWLRPDAKMEEDGKGMSKAEGGYYGLLVHP